MAEAKTKAKSAAVKAKAEAATFLDLDPNAITFGEQMRLEAKVREMGWEDRELTLTEFNMLTVWAILSSTQPDLTVEDVQSMEMRKTLKHFHDILGEG